MCEADIVRTENIYYEIMNRTKRILVAGAGGAPATNFVRSLRSAPEKFYLVGTDADPYYLARAETDARYLVPKASDRSFRKKLLTIIKKEKIDFVHVQNDEEILWFSRNRGKLPVRLFLPPNDVVVTCQDKYRSYVAWQKAGITVPKTMLISTPSDLAHAFATLGPPLWLRNIHGAAGKGSLPATSVKQATSWIDFHDGWGHFTAASYLSPHSVTWMSIWLDGNLILAQGRKRLYWEMGKVSPSGITGVTGAGLTIRDRHVDRIAKETILAIDPKPHGLYGVDLTYDRKGQPNPTEINIGRFFTTHHFFTQAGLNMPYIYTKLAFGEKVALPKRRINPLPTGLVWIRGMDFLPVLTTMKKLKK